MKYFVTGGAGMIGSALVLKLLEKGNEVCTIDNLSSGKRENLKPAMNDSKFNFIEGDIKDLQLLTRVIKGNSFVFHLAANADIKFEQGDQTDTDLKENTLGTYNILEAMRLNAISKIAFSSSSAIYGEPTIFPTAENYGPLKPISLYGASKLADEALITSFSHLFNLQFWIFRLANVVGEKSRKKGTTVLTDFIRKLKENKSELEILGNGNQKKSFLLLGDCVNGILTLVEKADQNNNIINLGNEDAITIKELAQIVITTMGLGNVKLNFKGGERGWRGDSPYMLLDTSLAKKLGWVSKHTSKQAIAIATQDLVKDLEKLH